MRRLCSLLIVAMGLTIVTTTSAGPAHSLPIAPAQEDDAEFAPGSGRGLGRILAIQTRSSGVAIGVVSGRATARYQGTQGNAEATTLDLGLLGTLSDVPLLCDRAASEFIDFGMIPQPLKVSSGGGPESERTAASGEPDGPYQFGAQEAAASPNSHAASSVRGMTIEVPGLLRIDGGRAVADSSLTPGRQRVATARTEIGELSLLGDLVVLDGLVWTAEHHSGATDRQDAAFEIGSLTLAGVPLPVGDPGLLAVASDAVNLALQPFGLELEFPVMRTLDGGAEVVSAPLRLNVSTRPEMADALAPILELVQPVRTAVLELLDTVEAGECGGPAGAVGFGYLIIDLVAAAMASGGGNDLIIGGAFAGTNDTGFDSPFGSMSPRPQEAISPAVTEPPEPAPVPEPTTPPTTVATSAGPDPVAIVAAPAADTSRLCITSHTVGRPGCSAGAALVAGLVALLVVGGLGVVDVLRTRRAAPGLNPEEARKS